MFHEVLPSLRRTGKYEMPKPNQQQNTKPTLDELVNCKRFCLAQGLMQNCEPSP
ncbi:hypothetical protein [Nostoc sp. UIC 10630]|uniref:hypothetical protein n=1 Tax=Nostoc sp. UIC 10630 TaxID=2100146 RepID=UPI00193147C7|nr:hypothetical protein [Nostoc sp. UIC 10630]